MRWRATAWDLRAAGATLALGALLFFVACLLTGATDEGGVAWTTRAVRTLPVVPLCGAAVTYLALRRAKRRGELLALESIGCSPARAAAFAVAGAVVLSAVAAFAVGQLRGRSLEAFFPRAAAHGDIVPTAEGFVDEARGVRIAKDGELSPAPKRDGAESPAPGTRGRRASAAIVLLALGAGLPLVAARAVRGRDTRAIVGAALMCVLCIFLLQAAAAGRAPPALACVPAAALLIFATLRYRSPTW